MFYWVLILRYTDRVHWLGTVDRTCVGTHTHTHTHTYIHTHIHTHTYTYAYSNTHTHTTHTTHTPQTRTRKVPFVGHDRQAANAGWTAYIMHGDCIYNALYMHGAAGIVRTPILLQSLNARQYPITPMAMS
jgi:hypothetical protein